MSVADGEVTVSLDELMTSKSNVASPTGTDNPDHVRDVLANYLKTHNKVTVDLSNTKSMSPSFAYVAFGKLYDEFRDSIFDRVDFINDPLDLKKRVDQAFKRRSAVLKSEEKN